MKVHVEWHTLLTFVTEPACTSSNLYSTPAPARSTPASAQQASDIIVHIKLNLTAATSQREHQAAQRQQPHVMRQNPAAQM